MTSDNLSSSSRERIKTMCSTTDGFAIAEADLRLRGPGDLQGLQQSGMLDLQLADLVDDEPLVCATRDEIHAILDEDPDLVMPQHHCLKQHLLQPDNQSKWSNIS